MCKKCTVTSPIRNQAIYTLQVLPFKLNKLGLVTAVMLCISSSLASKVVNVLRFHDFLLSCEDCLDLHEHLREILLCEAVLQATCEEH